MGVRVLAGIANAEEQPASDRVAAVTALFDRGWGKAPQPHTGEDDKDIRVTIRTITEGRGNGKPLTSTCRTTPVSDEPLAASQARRLRPPD